MAKVLRQKPEKGSIKDFRSAYNLQLSEATQISLDYLNAFGTFLGGMGVMTGSGTTLEEKREHFLAVLRTPIIPYAEYLRESAAMPGRSEAQSREIGDILRIAPKGRVARLDALVAKTNQELRELLERYPADAMGEDAMVTISGRLERIYQHAERLIKGVKRH